MLCCMRLLSMAHFFSAFAHRLPLNFAIFNMPVMFDNEKVYTWLIYTVFMFGAAVYVQGAALHTARYLFEPGLQYRHTDQLTDTISMLHTCHSAMFKNAVESIPHDDAVGRMYIMFKCLSSTYKQLSLLL